MSVLIDATPLKRKSKGDKKTDKVRSSDSHKFNFAHPLALQSAVKSKKAPEPAKRKKSAKAGKASGSKDEETVKRLKVCTPLILFMPRPICTVP